MKIRILYFPEPVDCTSDPHYLSYRSEKEMMRDILKVCESHLVKAIVYIACYTSNDTLLAESDTFCDSYSEGKLMTGPVAQKHKIAGLYFYQDAATELKLPPGLTGVKCVHENLEKLLDLGMATLSIGVVWTYFGSHNCSDYIIAHFDDLLVDYCNHDWYKGFYPEAYEKHLKELAQLLGISISDFSSE